MKYLIEKRVIFKRIMSVAILFFFAPLSATSKQLQLLPGKVHESCIQLAASENFKYSFTSSANVNFNIHYHLGQQVEYPVNLKNLKKHADTFKANLAQHYCLMWVNKGDTAIQLNFQHDDK